MTEADGPKEHAAKTYPSRIAYLLGAVETAEKAGFKPIASEQELLAHAPTAYYRSTGSIGKHNHPFIPPLFLQDRHPYVSELRVKRSYHVGDASTDTWDFLRHELTIQSMHIVIFESVNDVFLRIPGRGAPLRAMTPAARVSEIARIAAQLFAPPLGTSTWTPVFIAGLGEISHEPVRTAYSDRPMSAGVVRDDLIFWTYKYYWRQTQKRKDPRSWFKGIGL